MVKQIPMLATRVVSRRFKRTMARMVRGTTIRPTATRMTRNATRRATVPTSGPAARPLPDAIAVSTHQQDGDQILHDQHADDELAQRPGDPLLVECLRN